MVRKDDNYYVRQQEEANRIAKKQYRLLSDVARAMKSQVDETRKLRRAFEMFADFEVRYRGGHSGGHVPEGGEAAPPEGGASQEDASREDASQEVTVRHGEALPPGVTVEMVRDNPDLAAQIRGTTIRGW